MFVNRKSKNDYEIKKIIKKYQSRRISIFYFRGRGLNKTILIIFACTLAAFSRNFANY